MYSVTGCCMSYVEVGTSAGTFVAIPTCWYGMPLMNLQSRPLTFLHRFHHRSCCRQLLGLPFNIADIVRPQKHCSNTLPARAENRENIAAGSRRVYLQNFTSATWSSWHICIKEKARLISEDLHAAIIGLSFFAPFDINDTYATENLQQHLAC